MPELESIFMSGPVPYPIDALSYPFWLEFVAIAIAMFGAEGIDFLIREQWKMDEQRTAAVMVALSNAPSRGRGRRRLIKNFLVPFLQHPNHYLAMQAVDTLASLRFASAHDNVVPLLHHPSPYVAGAVLRYLAELFPEEAIPHLLKALESKEFPICDSAIDCLDDMGYVQALPQIRSLMSRENWMTRQAATTATANLTELVEDAKGASRGGDRD